MVDDDAETRQERVVKIDYTNWEGKRRIRTVAPIRIYFGSNQWHREPQWLLIALDIDRLTGTGSAAVREFAMKSIHSWE